MKLTDGALRSLTLPEGKAQLEIVDEGCRGLVLVVGARTKAWQCRFSHGGARVRMPLGKYPAMPLSEARALASAAMLRVDRGEDPRVADLTTVKAAWASYWSVKRPTLRHPKQDEDCWARHVMPTIGAMNLSDLSPLTFDRVQAAWVASGLGAGQVRPLRLLTGFQGWLLDRDMIAKPFIPRRVVRPSSAVHAVPSLEATRALLAWCEGQGLAGIQLALLTLTGARRMMIQGLLWSEVEDGALVWSAARMKAKRSFAQPLSQAAKAWLDRVPRTNSALVFPSLTDITPKKIDLSLVLPKSPLAGFRTHDLRASFATHSQEVLGISPAVISACLDHSPSSILSTTASYLKSDRLLWTERKDALDRWATLLAAPAAETALAAE